MSLSSSGMDEELDASKHKINNGHERWGEKLQELTVSK